MNYAQRSLGAYVTVEQLSGFHLAARQLPLIRNQRALAQLTGPFSARMRGRGLEFEDVRQYQAGDDIRAIDWRVSARTNGTYTKQFRLEKEKNVLIVVDQRQSMFFGSRCAMKSVLAADIATLIAWAANHKGDRVGGFIFNDSDHRDLRPSNRRKNILAFIHALVDFNTRLKGFTPAGTQSINDILLEVKRIAKPGTRIFCISDFHDISEESKALLHAITRHAEIIAIRPIDVLETRLPQAGHLTASNGIKKIFLNTDSEKTRKSYETDYVENYESLRKLFGGFKIPLIPAPTDQAPLPLLQTYFGNGTAGVAYPLANDSGERKH